MADEIKRYFASKEGVRATFVVGTQIVREMQSIQHTFPIATMAVGRAMIGSALLAAQYKPGQTVSLHFRGSGPLEMVFAESTFEGKVRGYTPNPKIELDVEDGKVPVGTAIGDGTLTVVRTTEEKEAQKGSVPLQTGEVGDDIAYFLHQSDQIASVVSLSVKVGAYGEVLAAGGAMIEVMPDADPEVDKIIVQNLQNMGSLGEFIEGGGSAEGMKKLLLSGVPVEEVEHDYDLAFTCRCSKERLTRALELFKVEDLKSMLDDGQDVGGMCEFCGRTYMIDLKDIQTAYDKCRKESLH